MCALKIVFMGTPDFSVPALACLIEAGHEIVAVYSQPPRKSGRGMAERLSPVHAYAQDKGIPVRTPINFKDAADVKAFADLEADVAIVVAYGLILPVNILSAPKFGCLNIHASLLPRWRGAAPIQRAIMTGDAQTGVTIMQMDAGLDTGDMLLRETVEITAETTAGSLHDELCNVGGDLVVKALEHLVDGTLEATPQKSDGVTYAEKIAKAEGRIDWSLSALEIDRHIRGLTPWPGAWFEAEQSGKRYRIKIKQAHVVEATGSCGEILDDQLLVACGTQALKVEGVQREGKSAAKVEDFLRGFKLTVGTVLQ